MTPEEREKMNTLCKQLQEEKNPQEFTKLIRELIELLEPNLERIHPERKPEPN